MIRITDSMSKRLAKKVDDVKVIEYSSKVEGQKVIKVDVNGNITKTFLIDLLSFFNRQYFNFEVEINNNIYKLEKKRVDRGKFELIITKNDKVIYNNI